MNVRATTTVQGRGAQKRLAGLAPLLLFPALLAAGAAVGQEAPAYLAPDQIKVQPGHAPGMKVKQLAEVGTIAQYHITQYVIVFSPGDEVLSGLTDFATRKKITDAHFTAIGALSSATLGWFDLSRKAYRLIPVPSQMEVDSIQGDIALYQGKPVVHAHAVLSGQDGHPLAGHLLEGHVQPTLEVFIETIDHPLTKKQDPATGLTLIDPDGPH